MTTEELKSKLEDMKKSFAADLARQNADLEFTAWETLDTLAVIRSTIKRDRILEKIGLLDEILDMFKD